MLVLKKLVGTKVRKVDLQPLVAEIERLFTSRFDNNSDAQWIFLCVEEEAPNAPVNVPDDAAARPARGGRARTTDNPK